MIVVRWGLWLIGVFAVLLAVPVLLDMLLHRRVCWSEPLVGALTAAAVVAVAYGLAPQRRLWAAFAMLCVGSALSYQLFDMWWYPECHPQAYERVRWPWPLAVLSGAAVFVALAVRARRRAH
ncbi:MAG: hypothetical protein AAGA11_10525 [Pseudomonadota bacterium]